MNNDRVPGATLVLAEFTSTLTAQQLGDATIDYAKRLLLDAIGCLVAGTRSEPARMACRAFDGLHDSVQGPATNFVNGGATSARDAAFVNGIALYSVGVNDIHRPSVSHPAGCVVPVVLALGEARKSRGEDLLAAMAAGYELMARLGAAMQPSHWDLGFHPTGTFGTFGAAATASRLLQLDPAQTASALGIAGSQAGGIQAFHSDGSLTMIYHAGRSAQNGVEAAVLAQQGFTGPHAVLEDAKGYARLTSTAPRLDELTRDLGRDFAIAATSFRPYYGCTLTIAASAAAHALCLRHPGRAAQATRVRVRVHPDALKVINAPDPRTLLAARLSMQFNVAIVLRRGDVLVTDATDDDLGDPAVRRLMSVTEVVPEPAIGYWGSAVEACFEDGSHDEVVDNNPKGDPANPMGWEDVERKFRLLTADVCSADAADRITAAVRGVEGLRGDALAAVIRAALQGGHQGGRR